MAINKVINKSTKSHGAMKNVIQYVLQEKKVIEGYADIIGPYEPDRITYDDVYQAFLEEKKSGRKTPEGCTHTTSSAFTGTRR